MTNFRIYANRQDTDPWSFDSGTQADEVHVQDAICFCGTFTMTDFSVCAGNIIVPKWWIETTDARVELIDGVARFYPVREA